MCHLKPLTRSMHEVTSNFLIEVNNLTPLQARMNNIVAQINKLYSYEGKQCVQLLKLQRETMSCVLPLHCHTGTSLQSLLAPHVSCNIKHIILLPCRKSNGFFSFKNKNSKDSFHWKNTCNFLYQQFLLVKTNKKLKTSK